MRTRIVEPLAMRGTIATAATLAHQPSVSVFSGVLRV